MQGKYLILLFGFIVSLLMAGLYIFQPPFLLMLDNKVFDALLGSVHNDETTGIPVIVDLDEKSLAQFGQWPWPRYRIALLLKKIQDRGALSVGLDLVFPEPDRTSLGNLKREISHDLNIDLELEGVPEELQDNDTILARTLSEGPFILGYKFIFEGNTRARRNCRLHPLNVGYLKETGAGEDMQSFFSASGVVCNVNALSRAAKSSGFFDAAPDSDGVLRRVPLIIEYEKKLYPCLAMATLMQALDIPQVLYKSESGGVGRLRLNSTTIPLDARGNLLIHYRGGRKTFKYISAGDILNDFVTEDVLKDRIVLLGTSAAGLKEIRATPLDGAFPGVEVHATIIDNILRGDFLYKPRFSKGSELALVLILGISSTFLLSWTRSVWSVVIIVIGCAGVLYGSQWLLITRGQWVSPLMPLLTLSSHFSVLAFVKYRFEERKLRQRNQELILTQDATIESLAALAETRDLETGGHIRRTKHYVKALAQHLKKHPKFKHFLDEETIGILFKMAALHDIGKVGVRDDILFKTGKLTTEEFEEVKKHTTYGYETLMAARKQLGGDSFLRLGCEIAYTHQEKWDGSGYPRGLKGEEIPISGRLMAVADVYDTLICKRIYKPPVTHEKAVETMAEGRGTQFDPDILDAFLEIQDTFRQIALRFADFEEERRALAYDGKNEKRSSGTSLHVTWEIIWRTAKGSKKDKVLPP